MVPLGKLSMVTAGWPCVVDDIMMGTIKTLETSRDENQNTSQGRVALWHSL